MAVLSPLKTQLDCEVGHITAPHNSTSPHSSHAPPQNQRQSRISKQSREATPHARWEQSAPVKPSKQVQLDSEHVPCQEHALGHPATAHCIRTATINDAASRETRHCRRNAGIRQVDEGDCILGQ